MQIEQLDSFGNAYSRSLQWRAVMLNNVFECLTWPPSTAMIEANCFRNCPIAKLTWSTYVPLLYAPPRSCLVGILLGCNSCRMSCKRHTERKTLRKKNNANDTTLLHWSTECMASHTINCRPSIHRIARLLCMDLDTTVVAVEENASLTVSVAILHRCC